MARAYVEAASDREAMQAVAESQTKVLDERLTQEGAATRQFVTAQTGLENNLARLHPLRADEARGLVPQWPQLALCVAQLVDSVDRRTMLSDWSKSFPAWLDDAPPSVLAWLGRAVYRLRRRSVRSHLLRQALEQGISPRSYWICRVAMAGPHTKQEVEQLLRPVAAEPLPMALLANLSGDQHGALAAIEVWKPTDGAPSATKLAIKARLQIAASDLDGAIEMGVAAFQEYTATGAALTAVEARLLRGSKSSSPAHILDLQEALTLAIECRDLRRKWLVDSAPAVLQAARAARVLGNAELAWRLARDGHGEATSGEARAEEVLNFAALMAA